MKTVFIDGSAGTTGLRIYERLREREDIELLTPDEARRKDPAYRKEMLCGADIAFLCLPDDAAREAVAMAQDADIVLIDTSTAHRTAAGWAYGFPELSPAHEQEVRSSRRIAVPGCHAGGYIALVSPLVRAGLIGKDAHLSCFSLTGYSGGGKKMIADYETTEDPLYAAPRVYGLTQTHKHLPEMAAQTGLCPPVFCPTVSDFYSGMQVTVPLHAADVKGGKAEIEAVFEGLYNGPVVRFEKDFSQNGLTSSAALSGKDSMIVTVHGNDERMTLCAVYDNLGKGASGAAVQCMNLALGAEMTKGLDL